MRHGVRQESRHNVGAASQGLENFAFQLCSRETLPGTVPGKERLRPCLQHLQSGRWKMRPLWCLVWMDGAPHGRYSLAQMCMDSFHQRQPKMQDPHLVMQIIFLGVQPPKIILKSPILIRFGHANPVCLRTQENNFGSKYVENISRLFWKRPATGK